MIMNKLKRFITLWDSRPAPSAMLSCNSGLNLVLSLPPFLNSLLKVQMRCECTTIQGHAAHAGTVHIR